MTEFRLFYIPCKNDDEAKAIARHLLELQLIACANIVPAMTSMYRWKGKTIEDAETLLMVKSHDSLKEIVIQEVQKKHSYECPCIAALPIDSANLPYLEWMGKEMKIPIPHR